MMQTSRVLLVAAAAAVVAAVFVVWLSRIPQCWMPTSTHCWLLCRALVPACQPQPLRLLPLPWQHCRCMFVCVCGGGALCCAHVRVRVRMHVHCACALCVHATCMVSCGKVWLLDAAGFLPSTWCVVSHQAVNASFPLSTLFAALFVSAVLVYLSHDCSNPTWDADQCPACALCSKCGWVYVSCMPLHP